RLPTGEGRAHPGGSLRMDWQWKDLVRPWAEKLFDAFLAMFVALLVWIFGEVAWYWVVLLGLSLFFTLVFGFITVKKFISDERQAKATAEKEAAREARRAEVDAAERKPKLDRLKDKKLRAIFQAIIDEGSARTKWADEEIDDWVFRVCYAI